MLKGGGGGGGGGGGVRGGAIFSNFSFLLREKNGIWGRGSLHTHTGDIAST